MTHEQFCIWLHGYLEISGAKTLGEEEVQVIKDHLGLFFDKQTPNREEVNSCETGKCGTCLACRIKDSTSKKLSNCNCPVNNYPSILCPVHRNFWGVPYIQSPFPGDFTAPIYDNNKIIC